MKSAFVAVTEKTQCLPLEGATTQDLRWGCLQGPVPQLQWDNDTALYYNASLFAVECCIELHQTVSCELDLYGI